MVKEDTFIDVIFGGEVCPLDSKACAYVGSCDDILVLRLHGEGARLLCPRARAYVARRRVSK